MDNLNLDNFNPKKAEIVALAEECRGLKIDGVEDKTGYELVNQYRLRLKRARVDITKQGKDLRAGALEFQRKVIEYEKELISLIEPTETELENKQKAIDEEKEKLKRIALLPDRKEKLFKIEIDISDDDLLKMDDNAFSNYLNEKTSEFLSKKEEAIRLENEKIEAEKRKIQEAKEAEEKEKKHQLELEKARKEAETNALKKAEEDKKKAIEEERARAEEERKRLIADQEKKEADRLALIEKQKQEEKEEQEKLEKRKKYQKFLSDNGYNEKTKDSFLIQNNVGKITLYKKVADFKI